MTFLCSQPCLYLVFPYLRKQGVRLEREESYETGGLARHAKGIELYLRKWQHHPSSYLSQTTGSCQTLPCPSLSISHQFPSLTDSFSQYLLNPNTFFHHYCSLGSKKCHPWLGLDVPASQTVSPHPFLTSLIQFSIAARQIFQNLVMTLSLKPFNGSPLASR